MRSEGNDSNSQQTLKVLSCDSGTKSSLGLNCYCTRIYIHTKTSTRSHSASATDAAKYPTCLYSDFKYQYTALLIVFIVLRQRSTQGKENDQRVPRMATRNPHSPISI